MRNSAEPIIPAANVFSSFIYPGAAPILSPVCDPLIKPYPQWVESNGACVQR